MRRRSWLCPLLYPLPVRAGSQTVAVDLTLQERFLRMTVLDLMYLAESDLSIGCFCRETQIGGRFFRGYVL